MSVDQKKLAQLADWEAAAVAIALPWSISTTSILLVVCLIALIWLVRDSVVEQTWAKALCWATFAALFLANIVFVATSRADIVVLPVLIVLLGWRWSRWRGTILAGVAVAVFAAGTWLGSPY